MGFKGSEVQILSPRPILNMKKGTCNASALFFFVKSYFIFSEKLVLSSPNADQSISFAVLKNLSAEIVFLYVPCIQDNHHQNSQLTSFLPLAISKL